MTSKFNPYSAPITSYMLDYQFETSLDLGADQKFGDYQKIIIELLGKRKLTSAELYNSFWQKNANININQDKLKTDSFLFPKLLSALYKNNIIEIKPAIDRNRDGRLFCMRCLQFEYISKHDCAACKDNCYVCTACAAYGEVRSCLAIISLIRRDVKIKNIDNKTINNTESIFYRYPLTVEQVDASQKIKEQVLNGKSVLVWAVCGSGKTEMIFATIAAHKDVLLATPRRDVVMELLPRLSEAFPDKKVHAVYGGSSEKHIQADITIATTHQLLRYTDKIFSLVIIDEIDAFPYAGDELLQTHAHRIGNNYVYMTATPSEQLLTEVKQKNISLVTLFYRHHGKPLPEPQFIRCQNLMANLFEKAFGLKTSYVFNSVLKRLPQKGTVMIFVATIKKGKQLLELLINTYPNKKITFVHAKDPQRAEKIVKLRQADYDWIITTTILERGVTIADSHVIVVNAEHQVFNKSTLVQIAGRVGRTQEHPSGQVIFLGEYMTKAIKQAQQDISYMNKKWKEQHDGQ